MEAYLDEEMAPLRLGSLVIGSLATAAQILAIAGIYGMTAFIVGRRSRELAVRLALGATRGRIVRLILGRLAKLLTAGLAIGLIGGIAVERVLEAVVTSSADVRGATWNLVVGGALLAATAVASALGPALRAASLDPRVTLAAE